ncbi:MAG: nuclear transport factor 2 family protein, partial [Mesorhizobium sp.]
MTRLASLAAGALLAVSTSPANSGPQEDRNIQLIKDYYAAYATGNPEAVRPFLALDIVWRIPGHH